MMPVDHNPALEPVSLKFAGSFIVLTILAGLGVGVARVLTSLYAVHIQATELQLGLIAAAQSIGLLFMALPVGVLVQRFGSLKIFALGSVLGAGLYSLQSLYANAWYLLVLTVLVSFILPMRFVSIHTVFLSHLKRLGPTKAGWFRGSHMMGFFLIAPALTIFLIEKMNYHGAFFCGGSAVSDRHDFCANLLCPERKIDDSTTEISIERNFSAFKTGKAASAFTYDLQHGIHEQHRQ